MNLRGLAALWRREVARFLRDRARIIGALAPPVLFWFLIGSGLGASLRVPGAPEGMSYLQYFYAGTSVLIVLFTSVFATITLIEDRREGFLQAILVSPVSRLELALGKTLGAATVGLLQGALFLALAVPAGLDVSARGLAAAFGVLALTSLGLTSLGVCLAWRSESTQGFHAVMNLFLIPLWMLSGSLFPASTAPPWLAWVIRANPLTYAVSGLQHALAPAGGAASAGLPPATLCWTVLAVFAAAMLAVTAWVMDN